MGYGNSSTEVPSFQMLTRTNQHSWLLCLYAFVEPVLWPGIRQVQENNKDVMDALELMKHTRLGWEGWQQAGIYGRNVCLEQARSRSLSFHLLEESCGEIQCRVYHGFSEYPLQCTFRRGQEKNHTAWIVNTGNMSWLLGPRLTFNPTGSQRWPSPLAQHRVGRWPQHFSGRNLQKGLPWELAAMLLVNILVKQYLF